MSKIIANSTTNTSWLQKYDDGWIEQGGKLAVTFANKGSFSFTFPVPFTSTPLSLDTTVYTTKTGDQYGFELCVTNLTATGATLLYDFGAGGSYIKNIFWTARGI